VIQEGGYTFKHPWKGYTWGRTPSSWGSGLSAHPHPPGHIIVPTQMTILNDQGELENFGSGWDYYHSLMLIGTWQQDHRLKWQVSEQIRPTPTAPCAGCMSRPWRRCPMAASYVSCVALMPEEGPGVRTTQP